MEIRRRRCRGDDGAALVEGSLVALPFFILIFGILDGGLLFKDYLGLNAMTGNAARVATTQADALSADYHILTSIDRSAAPLDRSKIQRIVIYDAATPSSGPPAACLAPAATGTANQCNVYFPAAFDLPESDFDCNDEDGDGTDGLAPDQYWCPVDRAAYQFDSSGVAQELDLVGVSVEYQRDSVTGLFGSAHTFSSTTVLRIEPQGRIQP